jgi:hypothetical protein
MCCIAGNECGSPSVEARVSSTTSGDSVGKCSGIFHNLVGGGGTIGYYHGHCMVRGLSPGVACGATSVSALGASARSTRACAYSSPDVAAKAPLTSNEFKSAT